MHVFRKKKHVIILVTNSHTQTHTHPEWSHSSLTARVSCCHQCAAELPRVDQSTPFTVYKQPPPVVRLLQFIVTWNILKDTGTEKRAAKALLSWQSHAFIPFLSARPQDRSEISCFRSVWAPIWSGRRHASDPARSALVFFSVAMADWLSSWFPSWLINTTESPACEEAVSGPLGSGRVAAFDTTVIQ